MSASYPDSSHAKLLYSSLGYHPASISEISSGLREVLVSLQLQSGYLSDVLVPGFSVTRSLSEPVGCRLLPQ